MQVGRKLTDKFEFLAETHISSPFMLCVAFGFTFTSVQMQQTKYSFAQNNCNKYSAANFRHLTYFYIMKVFPIIVPYCLLQYWKIFSATSCLMLMPGKDIPISQDTWWHTNCFSAVRSFSFL